MRRLRLRGPTSARGRVLVIFVGLLAVSTLVSTVLLRSVLAARTGERVDEALAQEVGEFRALAEDGLDPRTGERFASLADVFDLFLVRNVLGRGEDLYTFVGSAPYRTTAGPGTPRQIAEGTRRLGAVTETTRADLESPRRTYRVLAVPVVFEGRRAGAFAVTEDLTSEEDEVAQATQVAAGVSLVVLVLASLLAFALAGRVLAPLRDLTDTARSITDADLSRRIDVSGDDEVAQAGRTFNAMLDRIEGALVSQRAFVSDAGHELRTPITIVRGHLELLDADPEARRETLALVDDELDRMSRMVEDLLTLAKAERPDFLRTEHVDLDLLTEELLAKAQRLAERPWTLDAVGTGLLVADRQRLTQAMMSLASNAAQHTPPGTPIALGSAIEGGEALLWVRDEGPGVPAADRERIFERFSRGGSARRASTGAGLGLAIVRVIAEAHGGHVELRSLPGRGATFCLHIPIDAVETGDDLP